MVLPDQTLANLQAADPVSAQEIGDAFNHWDHVEMFFKGRSVRSGGHGFCSIGRKPLLNLLQQRCLAMGVELGLKPMCRTTRRWPRTTRPTWLVACDGLNSRVRTRYAATYQPNVELRDRRLVWLCTRQRFDAFTLAFERTEHGWFAAHAYPFNADTSTFIVETPLAVWQAHGLDPMSRAEGIAFCERPFARYLNGQPLINNATFVRGSAIWIQFPRGVCQRWVHVQMVAGQPVPIVLIGDAAPTAYFSIGSGTKLAMEDAIELARCLATAPDTATALQTYEALRSVKVLKIQNAARNSTEWFENVDRHSAPDTELF